MSHGLMQFWHLISRQYSFSIDHSHTLANSNSTCPSAAIWQHRSKFLHYNDVIMGTIASQITSLTIVYSIVYSDADQRKHQSSASLAFVRGIHGWPLKSPHKWPVTRKMSPFNDVIMTLTQVITSLTAPIHYLNKNGLWRSFKDYVMIPLVFH